MTSSAILDDVAKRHKSLLDEFSMKVISGAVKAFSDATNPLRLNFHSTAIRILYEHLMDSYSPIEEVMKAAWYKPEKDDGKPTRGQRIKFAVQGGLSDALVSQQLSIDVAPLRKRLLDAVDQLSKQVHGRENTLVSDPDEQDAIAVASAQAMASFLDLLAECRAAVIEPIEERLDETAVDEIVNSSLAEIDELASHFSLEEVYVNHTRVAAIRHDAIVYRAEGTVSVILQWGSNSDVRRGDGAELDQRFPFTAEVEVPISDPWNFDDAAVLSWVDTTEWHDAMAPDPSDEY
ncbi:hypothetical protein ASE36_18955 [Rhizobium sp. Root274]|uniref:pPIWI-associating nuclease domain-containing protein n=1 Tax=unclassified Rhizobium TaxID=2613769 RepID=UPI00071512FF|nr:MULTISPECIES: hypothetical protein [unclassified Rhizobium]KRD27899.1 hypothetical protein ASE36_18955 [Rhizobium sp. Root274]